MMRRSRLARAFALSFVLVVSASGIADAQVELEPVVTGSGDQFIASANNTYIAYTQWTRAEGFTAFARPLAGGTSTKLNADGTKGLTGGFDPGTNSVIYQQFNRRRFRSDLFFFDLDTGDRSKIPDVNSRAWEWAPRISDTFIAFQRDRFRNGDLYVSIHLVHRETGEKRTIGTWRWDRIEDLFLGSVGDRFLTYTRATKRNIFAYLYDWESDSQTRIPTVDGKPQYGPVVDEVNSTVYFTRSTDPDRCGRNADIWRLPIDLTGEATLIVDLPSGVDTGWAPSITANEATGGADLYVERWDCASNYDIYVARGVDAEPTP